MVQDFIIHYTFSLLESSPSLDCIESIEAS
jgi:hypothetical protein